jgi:hypothetical protein
MGGGIVKLLNDWHVLGIVGDNESTTMVVGSESNCRMICKLMVSSGQWENAWLYPPGSSSDDIPPGSELDGMVIKNEPFEVYTVTDTGGVAGHDMSIDPVTCSIEYDDIHWVKFYHHCFDE